MDTLYFLQHYWWALISLLGALLVFMMFVQGGETLIFGVARTDQERERIIGSLGHKWEITFTTLVTFGGAAFASFPLFYSTSFGGAYWLWMSILFLFVIQAVSFEFRNKAGNLLGQRGYDIFLFLNGSLGTFLLGVAVATLFSGGSYFMDKINITNGASNVISTWSNSWMGLESIAVPFNVVLGLVLLFAARTLGLLFTIEDMRHESSKFSLALQRCKKSLTLSGLLFVLLFVLFLVMLFLRTGYSVDQATGYIAPVKYKYLLNMLQLVWPAAMLLVGVVLVLAGLAGAILLNESKPLNRYAFYITGAGTVLAVWSLLICAAYNNTAYFPSLVSVQDSLTLFNSSSSKFTLTVMSFASLAIPFVLAYIIVVWRKMSHNGKSY
ncbi:MAG: cytochrome d ubiquinol oxidase subunit II [Bacteroidales bacterium]|nr:cytochrome d ubiquinol oxidase subunit II [Bacteroidales bacterium]